VGNLVAHDGPVLTSVHEILDLTSSEVLIGGLEIIHSIEDQWRQLCEETNCEPFLTPEWIGTYIHAFEQQNEVVLVTSRVADRLTAVLPLVRKKGLFSGLPVVKLVGAANSHSVRFDILRAPGPEGDAAIKAIWRLLKHAPNWHLLEFPMFPAEGPCQRLMSYAVRDGFRTRTLPVCESPYLRIKTKGCGQMDWLGETSRHFRHELRRFARVLEAQTGGPPRLVRMDHPAPKMLHRFFALEASGWKGKEGSAIQCRQETLTFYEEVARFAAGAGQFCLHLLEAGGKVVAAAFSLETNDCYYAIKIAYDESFRRAGPGHLLINAILEECARKRIRELDFGGSRERFKTSWTSAARQHFTGTVFNRDFYPFLLYQVRTNLLPALKQKYTSVLNRLRLRNGEGPTNTSSQCGSSRKSFVGSNHG